MMQTRSTVANGAGAVEASGIKLELKRAHRWKEEV